MANAVSGPASVKTFILVVNMGSTSAKLSLFEFGDTVHHLPVWQATLRQEAKNVRIVVNNQNRETTETSSEPLAVTVEKVLHTLCNVEHAPIADRSQLRFVGHRVVHGGSLFTEPTIITAEVFNSIQELCELAPLHQPGNIQGIQTTAAIFPDATTIACFDTAYFRHLPLEATVYPVPYDWYEKHQIQRYGFHGISHQYCSDRAASLLEVDNLKVVTCHLGGGASITSSWQNRPVATTMGFTPLEGVMMATRSGSIDPGIILHMLENGSHTLEEMVHALNYESGLFGISGESADIRTLQRLAGEGHARAQLALKIYIRSVAANICSVLPALGGAQALVFTAGVGENSSYIRERVSNQLSFLGIQVDAQKNQSCKTDMDISHSDATLRTLVVHTREEFAIAQSCASIAVSICQSAKG